MTDKISEIDLNLTEYISLVEMANKCQVINVFSAFRGFGYRINDDRVNEKNCSIRELLKFATNDNKNMSFSYLLNYLVKDEWGEGFKITHGLLSEILINNNGGPPSGCNIFCKVHQDNSWIQLNKHNSTHIINHPDRYNIFAITTSFN